MERDNASSQVLLIEDNPGDVGLIRRALAHGNANTRLHVVHDGPEALVYLARCTPDLILLDLSLPKMDGCEVLAQIRRSGDLAETPVVMLSSSQAEQDIVRSYEHSANCFVTKPLDLDRYIAVIRAIQHFWLAGAGVPRNRTNE
jgi:CheY-like chemotaxis protein